MSAAPSDSTISRLHNGQSSSQAEGLTRTIRTQPSGSGCLGHLGGAGTCRSRIPDCERMPWRSSASTRRYRANPHAGPAQTSGLECARRPRAPRRRASPSWSTTPPRSAPDTSPTEDAQVAVQQTLQSELTDLTVAKQHVSVEVRTRAKASEEKHGGSRSGPAGEPSARQDGRGETLGA